MQIVAKQKQTNPKPKTKQNKNQLFTRSMEVLFKKKIVTRVPYAMKFGKFDT